MVAAHPSILRYFNLVDKVPGYQELPIIIPEGGVEQEGIEGGWGDEAKNSADAVTDAVTDADTDAAGALALNGARSVAAGAAAAAAAATTAKEKTEEEKIIEAEE